MGFCCDKECPAYPVCFAQRLGDECKRVLENFEKLGLFDGDSFVQPIIPGCDEKCVFDHPCKGCDKSEIKDEENE